MNSDNSTPTVHPGLLGNVSVVLEGVCIHACTKVSKAFNRCGHSLPKLRKNVASGESDSVKQIIACTSGVI